MASGSWTVARQKEDGKRQQSHSHISSSDRRLRWMCLHNFKLLTVIMPSLDMKQRLPPAFVRHEAGLISSTSYNRHTDLNDDFVMTKRRSNLAKFLEQPTGSMHTHIPPHTPRHVSWYLGAFLDSNHQNPTVTAHLQPRVQDEQALRLFLLALRLGLGRRGIGMARDHARSPGRRC